MTTLRLKFDDHPTVSPEESTRKKALGGPSALDADDEVRQWVHRVVHDLRNLLCPMMGELELAISKSPSDSKFHRRLQRAHKASLRMLAFTEGMLRGVDEPEDAARTDVNRQLREIAESASVGRGTDSPIELRLAPDLPAAAISKVQLDRVVTNLVRNARQAMTEGGRLCVRTRYCRLGSRRKSSWVVVSVSDEGSGMTHEVARRAFTPRFSTKSPCEGSGLGLVSVYSIVRKCRGRIRLTTRPGKGTRISLYLPVAEPSTFTCAQAG